MKAEDLKARTFQQTSSAKKDEDGYWKFRVEITETVVYNDGREESESIVSESMNKDFDIAHKIALHSALSELGDLVYDAGYDSLIEARAHERELENDDSKDNQDTPTQ